MSSLPTDDAERGKYPMADGLLDYFPNALAEVSRISYEGNQKHNPGEPMHWARSKSTDHRNKIIRHTVDSVADNEEGIDHAAQAAWRALAHLQEKIEKVRGVPLPANAQADSPVSAVDAPYPTTGLTTLLRRKTYSKEFTVGKLYEALPRPEGHYAVTTDYGAAWIATARAIQSGAWEIDDDEQ